MWLTAGLWMSLAAASGFLAIRLKMPAALVEIIVGMLAGNLIAMRTNAWIDFVAGFGSILLTFLAGAEIDPAVLRRQLLPSSVLGAASFGAPFVAAMAYTYWIAHWTPDAAKIAGIAMSTTSVAVVYAVMIESGLAGKEFGQLILAACFFTDLGTVVALGLLFANYNLWLAGLTAGIAVAVVVIPKVLPYAIHRTRRYVSEPALRVLFAVIFLLAALATYAKSEGVLPAYFLGLACAGMMTAMPDVKRRLQTMTMALLAPFYFLKGRNVHRVWRRTLEHRADRGPLLREGRREIRRRAPVGANGLPLQPDERELLDADDGDRLDVRHDFEFIRTYASLHKSSAVHRSRDGRDLNCRRPHRDRSVALQTARGARGDGGRGSVGRPHWPPRGHCHGIARD